MAAVRGNQPTNIKCKECGATNEDEFWACEKDASTTYWKVTRDTCRCENFYADEYNPLLQALLPEKEKMLLFVDSLPEVKNLFEENVIHGEGPCKNKKPEKISKSARKRRNKAKESGEFAEWPKKKDN
jgi:hypothetical protein